MLLSTSYNNAIDGISLGSSFPVSLTITNGGFEDGDLTGWTAVRDSFFADTTEGGLNPHGGSYFARGTSISFINSWVIAYQDLDITGDGVTVADIDAEIVKVDVDWYQAVHDTDDLGCMLVRFLDNSSNQIGPDVTIEAFLPASPDTWEAATFEAAVPVSTRTIRLYMMGQLQDSPGISTSFDDITVTADDLGCLISDTRTTATVVFRSTTGSPPTGINEALGTSPSIADMDDAEGNATGWGLTTNTGAFTSSSNTGGEEFSRIIAASNAWAQGYSATDTTGGTDSITLRIDSLDNSKTYDIKVHCARNSPAAGENDRDTDVDVGGSAVTIVAMHNITNLAEFDDVSPSSGNIDLTIATNSLANFGYIQAFTIAENA